MFDLTDRPRIFGCAPGIDFSKALVDGLTGRFGNRPPEEMARVEIFVNTRRMQRRIFELFDLQPACLLPKIRLVTDLATDPMAADLPAPVSPLRRRLELSQLISKLLDQQPDLAPRSALFDLADSLALLMAEMQDEAVSPDDIFGLAVTDASGHWQRSQKFLEIVTHYFGVNPSEPPDQEARQRRAVEALAVKWGQNPPQNPVIVAGSTGSRGSTALLMGAVAKLPQGALILPGFDFDQPKSVWENLENALQAEDHPQFRFRRILQQSDVAFDEVQEWLPGLNTPSPARNRLISLALRPAPVTNQWLAEGPNLTDIKQAAADMALIAAPSERVEAVAIALALRQAADRGITAALVTPDRLLTRRVRASLDQWRIEPDASVGDSLDQTAPGRLLRHVAELFGTPLSAEALLVILKHPLVNVGAQDRGAHLRWTRELEQKFRRTGPAFPCPKDILDWANFDPETKDRQIWAEWLTQTVFDLQDVSDRPLADHLQRHILLTSALSAGPGSDDTTGLWAETAGREARQIIDDLTREAQYGGILSAFDYVNLFHSVLKRGEVRDPVLPHPDIMIWGTLEARVQGADLVILGGLNEGVWPEHATPDPWLNREMRAQVGLLLPERRIGLSAHDFQQAIGAKRVILTRSVRNAEAQTVPSRWLNRLTNLMDGMSDEGREAAKTMHQNGQYWLDMVQALESPAPVDSALRPAPAPPVSTRPTQLSVTAISRLIRDPYAIYARYILGLKPLDPLHQKPDAPLRGTIMHRIFERFITEHRFSSDLAENKRVLLQIADQVLASDAPWPVARILWRAKLDRIADRFMAGEALRQANGHMLALERVGAFLFAEIGFTLTAKADRIDRSESGGLLIYDYKTGQIPTADQQKYYDKQLLLEAVLAQEGAFEKIGPAPVANVGHIGVGTQPKFSVVPLSPDDVATARAELIKLIAGYQQPAQGYASRRAMASVRYAGDYDHLARFGEWNETKTPTLMPVGT